MIHMYKKKLVFSDYLNKGCINCDTWWVNLYPAEIILSTSLGIPELQKFTNWLWEKKKKILNFISCSWKNIANFIH